MSGSNKGYKWTPEQREKLSRSKKEFYRKNPEHIENWKKNTRDVYWDAQDNREIQSNELVQFYKKHPEKKDSISKKIQNMWKEDSEYRNVICDAVQKQWKDPNNREEQSKRIKRAHEENPQQAKNHSAFLKDLWKDPDFQKKQAAAKNNAPNKKEVIVLELLEMLFPYEYKYVGDYQVFFGGKNPDFINVNGQKKLIEMFGDYWHSEKVTGETKEEHEQNRINHFKQFGFDTLIVWETEIGNLIDLKRKLVNFHFIGEYHG